jgi:hypothetical protein
MTRVLHPKTALALAFAGLGVIASACGSVDDSGQTGSPNHDPPEYETPAPVNPNTGGSVDGGGGGQQRPIVVQPVPTPSPATVVDSTLLVAGDNLTLLDVSAAESPSVVGRLETGGRTELLAAPSRGRIALVVTASARYSGESLPTAPLPWIEQRVLEVDASEPSTPVVANSFAAPVETAGIVPLATGYALFGAHFQAGEASCGELIEEIGREPPPLEMTSIRRYTSEGGQFGSRGKRTFGPSLFAISSDSTHAIRIGTDGAGVVGADAELELIELATLETKLLVAVDGTALAGTFSADYAGGVLLVAGGTSIFGWDQASGSALDSLETPTPVAELRFLEGGELASLVGGGNPSGVLVRVAGGSEPPSLELVTTPNAGVALEASYGRLEPFGDGFVELGGVGLPSAPKLVAKRYALDENGALVFVDQVQTDWYYSSAQRFGIDGAAQRITYTLPIDDTNLSNVGVIAPVDGVLAASSQETLSVFDPRPIVLEGTLLATSAYSVQSVSVDLGATAPALEAGEIVTTGLASIWAEREHAGLLFTLHRSDTGRTALRYRPSVYSPATTIELPHAANAMVALDDTHLLVLGTSRSGECEELLEKYGDNFSECTFDKPNGASALAIDGEHVTLLGSVELTNDLLPKTAEGVDQRVEWAGFVRLDSGDIALFGSRVEVCHSDESCAAIGTVAYPSGGGSPSSCGSEPCPVEPGPFDPDPPPSLSGYRNQSLLVPLALSFDGELALGAPVVGGARHSIHEVYEHDVSHGLLGYDTELGAVRAYPVRETIYNSEGNGIVDAHGRELARDYVQFIELDAAPGFAEKVNVPGQAVLLGGPELTLEGRGHALFTLDPRYRDDGSQYLLLHRVRIEGFAAHIEESIDVGPFVSARGAGVNQLALLSLPADYCASDARFELRIADLEGSAVSVSEPLVLEAGAGRGFGLSSYPPETAEANTVHLFGGPASNGRLIVDITTNPPSIVRYETRE